MRKDTSSNRISMTVQMAELKKSVRKNYTLYIFLLLPIIYFVVFKYIPMLGNVVAFRKFVPGKSYFGVSWEGLKYFKMFFGDPTFWKVFKNTVILSFSALAIGFPLPIIFALCLNELTQKRFKKLVQSITIIPRFLSTVVVISMLNTLLSPKTGIVNMIIEALGGKAIFFINEPGWFRSLYILSDIWQFLGWSSIIYMAVLSSADQEQYEASMVDGANKLQQIFHITIPLLLPTIAINLIISLGNILSVGFEKVLLMYQPSIYDTADVIQTYSFRIGLQGGNFSYGTAVGLFQGLISLSLLWVANKVTNKYWQCGLW